MSASTDVDSLPDYVVAARAEAAAEYPAHVLAEGGPNHYAATISQSLHHAILAADWATVRSIAADPYAAGGDVDMAKGALAGAMKGEPLTTSTDKIRIPSMRPEPERDQYGRYRLPDAAGRKVSWTRATTVVGALKDLNGLIGWKRRKVAEGLALTPALLERIPELAAAIEAAPDWRAAREAKALLDALCDEAAHEAGADAGSEAGTQAHTLTEYADAGRLDEVRHLATEAELADLAAYTTAMDAAGIVRPAEWIERIVVNSVTESAGTFDRIVQLADGRLVVADVKSQQSVDFGWLEICCQLAQYANADGMVDPESGVLEPLPADLDRSTGLVMHVPVGAARCDLYEIDLRVGWEAAQVAAQVRRLQARSKTLGWPFVTQPAVPTTHAIQLIRSAGHPKALEALWRDLHARGLWTPEHTEAARARKAELASA